MRHKLKETPCRVPIDIAGRRRSLAHAARMALAAFALLSVGGIGAIAAADAWKSPVRDDLSAEDLARVRAITRPAADFSKPETFEKMQGGAGTSRKRVNQNSFSHSSANITFEEEATSSSATRSSARTGFRHLPRRRHQTGLALSSTREPAKAAISRTGAATRPTARPTPRRC